MTSANPKILITGSDGFVAKNLILTLKEKNNFDLIFFNKSNTTEDLKAFIMSSNFIIHLAGENRPINEEDFYNVNHGLTKLVCEIAKSTGKKIPILFFSSMQESLDNLYGKSKKQGEQQVIKYNKETGNKVIVYRPPGIFGKWCKPNYNSVVATFCNNIANNETIKVNDENKNLDLVYIDDLVKLVIGDLNDFFNLDKISQDFKNKIVWKEIFPLHQITLGQLANKIKSFKDSRESLIIGKVGIGLDRALYSTYLTYLPKDQFSYKVESHIDERGSFVEMLKTENSGQFSFFTAHPGVTRGGHYHHSKTEKFLVIQGHAKYGFRNIDTNEYFEINTKGDQNLIVETIPGWSHDITNIGKDSLIVMLWANEIFDRSNPDTFASEVLNEKT